MTYLATHTHSLRALVRSDFKRYLSSVSDAAHVNDPALPQVAGGALAGEQEEEGEALAHQAHTHTPPQALMSCDAAGGMAC